MDEFIAQYQYHVAWGIYLVCGVIFSLFWWRLTRVLNHSGWRDLLRGIAVVVIFTPWFVSEAHDYAAPAVVVVAMDLIIGSTDNGLAGSLALLVAIALMLVAVIVKRLILKDKSG